MRFIKAALAVITLVLIIYAVNHGEESAPATGEISFPPKPVDDHEVTWGTLRELDKDTGKASEAVKSLEGKEIRVPGYIVPLDDDSRSLTEFLLVPYAGACVHTPPPPPNQMIYVRMVRGQKADYGLMDAVWLQGKLFIGRKNSPYGPTFYAMTATTVQPYQ